MDNMFQLQQNMTPEQIQQLGKERIKTQSELEQYYQTRQQDIALDAQDLLNKYDKRVDLNAIATQKVQDMPDMKEDEKESKRKNRMKKQLTRQAKRAIRKPEQNLISDQQFFDQSFQPSMLTPKYVLENYTAIALQLEDWKKKLDSYEQNPDLVSALSSERKFRLGFMQQRYIEADMAFQSAIRALGFSYNQEEKGTKKIGAELTEEEKQQALLMNQQLREKMEKQDEKMEEMVLEKVLEEGLVRVQPVMDEIRQDKAQDPEFAFIQSRVLSNVYQYDEIKNLKDLIEQYPEKYQQNKEQVDVLYEEFYHLMEVNAQLYLPSYALTDIQFDRTVVSSTALQKSITRRMDEYEQKMKLIRNRAVSIMNGVKFLLKGKMLTQEDYLVLQDYVKLDTLQAEQNRQDQTQASCYADRFRKKEATLLEVVTDKYKDHVERLTTGNNRRFMMLMIPGNQVHNERVVRVLAQLNGVKANPEEVIDEKQVHRELKGILGPFVDRIMNYEQHHFGLEEEDSWREQYEELQEISLFGMQVTDLGRMADPDAPEGQTIRDTLIGNQQERFVMKCESIQGYAFQTRAYAIMKAFETGTLSKDSVTMREALKIQSFFHLDKQEDITPQHILYYAKQQMKSGKIQVEHAYEKYVKSSACNERYEKQEENTEEYSHTEYHRQADEALKYAKEDYLRIKKEQYIEENKPKSEGDIPRFSFNETEYIGMLKQEIRKDKNSLETVSTERKQQIEEGIAKKEQILEHLIIRYALTKRHYQIADKDEEVICEPIFRSYSGVESMTTVREMSEEDFLGMCKLLAAGTLEDDLHIPERRAEYYEANKMGLEIYKAHMRERYERYHELLQGKEPTVDFIDAHYEELKTLGNNVQVDINLLTNVKEMINLDDPEDVMFYHMVQSYNAFTSFIYGMGMKLHADSKSTYQGVIEESRGVMKEAAFSIEYINKQGNIPYQQLQDKIDRTKELQKQQDKQLKAAIGAHAEQRAEIEAGISEMQATFQTLSEGADETFLELSEVFKNGFLISQKQFLVDACVKIQNRKWKLNAYLNQYRGKEVDEITAQRFYFVDKLRKALENQYKIYDVMKWAYLEQEKKKKINDCVTVNCEGILLYDRVKYLPEQARNIAQETEEEKLQYIGNVVQLKQYVERYGELEDLYAVRLKEIYEETVGQLSELGLTMEHAIQGVEGYPELTAGSEQYKGALSSDNPEVMVQGVHAFYQYVGPLQSSELSKEELWKIRDLPAFAALEKVNQEFGVDRVDKFTDEFRNGFCAKYSEMSEAIVTRMEEAIAAVETHLPQEMAEQDRKLLAAFLVSNTDLGKQYDASCVIKGDYFKQTKMFEWLLEYEKQHPEIAQRSGALSDLVSAASVKYRGDMKDMGYTEGILNRRIVDYHAKFGALPEAES